MHVLFYKQAVSKSDSKSHLIMMGIQMAMAGAKNKDKRGCECFFIVMWQSTRPRNGHTKGDNYLLSPYIWMFIVFFFFV